MSYTAIIGFLLMLVLMIVLIKGMAAPPIAFTLLPLAAAVVLGFGAEEIAGFIGAEWSPCWTRRCCLSSPSATLR